MGAIVEDDMDEVLRRLLRNDGHSAHVHEDGAVTVETPDPTVRLSQSNPQSNLGRMPHGADGQEIPLVTFAFTCPILEQLPADHAGRRHDDILSLQRSRYRLNGFFSSERQLVHADVLKCIRLECVLFYDHRVDLIRLPHMVDGLGNLLSCLFLFFAEDGICNPHRIKKRHRHLALLDMLRLIVYAGAPAPSD